MPEVQTKILVKDNKGNFRFVTIPMAPKSIPQKPRPATPPPAVVAREVSVIKEEPKKIIKIEQALKEVEPKPVFTPKVPSFVPQPTPLSKSTSILEFDAEDEEELRKIKAKTAGLISKEEPDEQRIVKEIVAELNLSFPDPILANRFEKIISAGLKELRSPIETKETLIRSLKVGGMGYSQAEADRIMVVLEKYLKVPRAQKPFLPKAVEKEVSLPKPPPVVPRPAYAKASAYAKATADKPVDRSVGRPTYIPAPAPVRQASPIPQVKRPVADIRPKVADIKKPSRLVGPLDELRLLNLVDFRRLGGSAFEIVERLKEKIDSLAEESFAKRTEGIKAWRESEIYRLYLEIGNESIAKNKPVRQIVIERQAAGRPTLTETEFAGILDLNKKLRF